MIERATGYIKGVLSGDIVTGKWLRLAMQRHLDDLARVGRDDFQYYFDEIEAARILDLYKFFKFSKGAESGKPFDIMPWWAAVVYLAYGWRRTDGGKRFRKVYTKVARGNAKTANLVTIGTIGFLFEDSADPEIYWTATKKDQARIGWDRQRAMLKMMVEDYPELRPILQIPTGHSSTRIRNTRGLSWVAYLGRDSEGEDGASPYYVLVDEFHAWDTDDLLNVMESGMVKVDNPVTWIITTAGNNPEGPNSEFLRACKNMLSGVADNPELLAFIYELDEGDDWHDKTLWGKANPGLGISVSITGLETEYNKIASQGIQKEIDFKVKNLNFEHTSREGWIPDDTWRLGDDAPDLEDLAGRECWAGLDLANTNDFNAFCLFFPPRHDEEKAVVLVWYWITDEAIEKHKSKRPFVARWVKEGFIKTTAGNVTDYSVILSDMLEVCEPYNVTAIAFDKALSSYLVPQLVEHGFRMEPYPQSPLLLSPPAKHIEYFALPGRLIHGGNPVLRWNMANVVMHLTTQGNYAPSKGRSVDKIDGVAAMLNAVGQWLKDRGEPQQKSYLLEEDLIFL